MGSIVNYEEQCPICGSHRLFSDFHYHTGEEFDACEACGFTLNITHLRDKEGIIREDGETYPMDGSLVCLSMEDSAQMKWMEIMPVTQDVTEECLRSALRNETTMLCKKDSPSKKPILHVFDDFRIVPNDSGVNQLIVEKSIVQAKCHCPRPDGLIVDFHPITAAEIAQLQLPEDNHPVADGDYYVSATDASGNSAAVCLKQKDAEKAGTMKIVEGVYLISEADSAPRLQFSFSKT